MPVVTVPPVVLVGVPPPEEVVVDAGVVVAAGVLVVAGVVVAGVVVEAAVVTAEVEVDGVVVDEVVVLDPDPELEPVVPVELVEPDPDPLAGVVGPRWSRVLSVAGVSAGALFGRLSATVLPPHAARTTPLAVAARSASGRARRAVTGAAEACVARTSGSR